MKQLLLPPIMREENQKLLAELEEYYGQNVGVRREQIGWFIDWFVEKLQSKRRYAVTKAVETARNQLASWKEGDIRAEEELFDGELKQQFLKKCDWKNLEEDWMEDDMEELIDEEETLMENAEEWGNQYE